MSNPRPLRPLPIIIPPRNVSLARSQPVFLNNYTNPRANILTYQGTPSPTTPSNLCPICASSYDNYSHKKSKIFNCGHEMCRDCILRIIEEYRSQRVYDENYQLIPRMPLCPFCRTAFIGQENNSGSTPTFSFKK